LPKPSTFSYFCKVIYSFLREINNRQCTSTYEITNSITEVHILAYSMNTNDHMEYNYFRHIHTEAEVGSHTNNFQQLNGSLSFYTVLEAREITVQE